MSASYQLAHFLINAVARGVPFSFDQLWLAALTSVPEEGNPVGPEVNASEYERIGLTFAAPTGTNTFSSAGQVSFATAQSSWGTISHLGLCTTAEKLTGLVIVHGSLSGTPTISANQILRINDVRLSFT